MKNKYNFTIGRKIFLSFFLIICLMSFIVLIGSFRIVRVNSLVVEVSSMTTQVKKLNSFGNLLPSLEQTVDKFLVAKYEENLEDLEKVLVSMKLLVGELSAQGDDEVQKKVSEISNALTLVEERAVLVFKADEGFDINIGTVDIYKKISGLKSKYLELSDYISFYVTQNIKDQQLLILQTKNQSLILGVVIIIFGIILSIFLSKSLSESIKILRNSVKKISKGDFDVKVDIQSNDEIGELANTFNQMTAELKDLKKIQENYKQNLEKKVKDKTLELTTTLANMQEEHLKLDYQRMATLNILEDVSESQEELKQKNIMINTLKNVSSDLAKALDAEDVVRVITAHIENNFNFYGFTFLIYDNFESGIIYQTHLFRETCEVCLSKACEDLKKYFKAETKIFDQKVLSIINSIRPKYTGAKIDNNADKSPKHFIYYPLISGEKIFGVMQISDSEKDILGSEEKELLTAIIANLVMALERLQSIVSAQKSKTVSLVESLSDGIVMYNTQEDVIIMNQAFSRYTGFSYDFFNMQDLCRLIPEQPIAKMVEASIAKGKISTINEVKLIKKHYELIILPVRDNENKIVGGAIIFHDNTRLKEIDRMKTEFLSVASHQLRTPLTAIKLFTEMLVKGDVGRLNDEQQEYLENVHESTERMVRLVDDLLNVTRIESGRLSITPQPVDVAKFIKSIISEAALLIDGETKKIVFKKDKTKFDKIPLDENLMRQVIHNLVVNAIRYSSNEDGLITVSLQKKDDKDFIISVRDNGIGIPEKAQRRIFEKFYRADNAIKAVTEGTGLGLYVSKMIVLSSAGKIWFKSEKNKGTEFFVQLPLAGMKEKKGERGLAIS